MQQFNFEYWLKGKPECHRISVMAMTREQAKQIVIGRYAPVSIRFF